MDLINLYLQFRVFEMIVGFILTAIIVIIAIVVMLKE